MSIQEDVTGQQSSEEGLNNAQHIVLVTATVLFRCLIVFGPGLPYIPQWLENNASGHADGLSLYTTFLSVFASCLKIAYWCGRPYDNYLLLQNFATIAASLIIIDQYIIIENRRMKRRPEDRNFVDFDVTLFWHWTNIMSYLQATGYMVIMSAIGFLLLSLIPCIMTLMIGLIVIVESCIMVPQLMRHFEHETTHGLNKAMICLFITWDLFKLVYMVTYSSPFAFKTVGVLQFLVDCGILAQIFYYGDHPPHNYVRPPPSAL